MSDTPADASVLQSPRFSRYSGVVSPGLLANAHCVVVGCGAIGRQLAMQLSSMGVGGLSLIDFDKVEDVNMGCQGWAPDEIGKFKSESLGSSCARANPGIKLEVHTVPFDKVHLAGKRHIFSCVDNMDVRKDILDSATVDMDLFVEARMMPEVFQVNFVHDQESRDAWKENWFPQKEAPELTCATRTTLHCASAAAAFMVQGWTKSLRKEPMPHRIDVHLLGCSMQTTWPAPPKAEEKPAGVVQQVKP